MGKITNIYKSGTSIYPSGIELVLDSGEKITIGNSSFGIKIYQNFFIFPKLIWRCDNVSLIEKIFPILKTDFIGSPLEKISHEILDKFKTKKDLIFFLENFKA